MTHSPKRSGKPMPSLNTWVLQTYKPTPSQSEGLCNFENDFSNSPNCASDVYTLGSKPEGVSGRGLRRVTWDDDYDELDGESESG